MNACQTFRKEWCTERALLVSSYDHKCPLCARPCPSAGTTAVNKSQGPCPLRDHIPEVVREMPDKRMSKAISDRGDCREDDKTRRCYTE